MDAEEGGEESAPGSPPHPSVLLVGAIRLEGFLICTPPELNGSIIDSWREVKLKSECWCVWAGLDVSTPGCSWEGQNIPTPSLTSRTFQRSQIVLKSPDLSKR